MSTFNPDPPPPAAHLLNGVPTPKELDAAVKRSLEEQPQPGHVPNAPTQTVLYTPDSLGPERLLCLEAIIAEHYAHFERRKVNGVWKWRQPRNPNLPDKPDWVLRPPTLLREPNTLDMFDVLVAQQGLDWMIAACVLNIQENNMRAYLGGIGSTHPNGAFVGKGAYKVLAMPANLTMMILLQQLSGKSINDMHAELFPEQHKQGG